MSEHDGEQDEHGESPGTDLGMMAQASLGITGLPGADSAIQDPIEGTDYTVLSFMGLKYTMLEQVPPIGTRLHFEIRAVVVGNSEQLMANEQIRHEVKCKPTEIVLIVDPAGDAADGPATY